MLAWFVFEDYAEPALPLGYLAHLIKDENSFYFLSLNMAKHLLRREKGKFLLHTSVFLWQNVCLESNGPLLQC